jgi:hypothetical protein
LSELPDRPCARERKCGAGELIDSLFREAARSLAEELLAEFARKASDHFPCETFDHL